MRLKIHLSHPPGIKIPINYNYYIQSWIYKVISKADSEFSHWLHNNGFEKNGKNFKLFTFDKLRPQRYRIHKKSSLIELQEQNATLIISFLVEDIFQNFIKGLFSSEQNFYIGDGIHGGLFAIEQIEILEKPLFHSKMNFRFETPCCIPHTPEGKKYPTYLNPQEDIQFINIFFNNLINKTSINPRYKDGAIPMGITGLKLLNKPHKKLITIKQNDLSKKSEIGGYIFECEVTAPVELIETGYYAGFGVKGSMGFGFAEIIKLNHDI